MTKYSKLIEIIKTSSDIAKLQNWINNAEREGATDVADAAPVLAREQLSKGHRNTVPGMW